MTIRPGDRGARVASLQRFLVAERFLAAGEDDGVWGPISAGALASWQRENGLEADGIPGPKTLAAIESAGYSPWLEEEHRAGLMGHVVETADRLGMRPQLLEAFRLVESGSGPNAAEAIRFEPHVFLRLVPGADIPYTPSGRGAWSLTASETGRRAFRRAYALDPPAAVRATSWGLFQVLGEHLLSAYPGADGQESPGEAVKNFNADPIAASFRLVEAWFRASPRALRAATSDPPDLRSLVRYYNGPGQVDHYAEKLEEALGDIEGRA